VQQLQIQEKAAQQVQQKRSKSAAKVQRMTRTNQRCDTDDTASSLLSDCRKPAIRDTSLSFSLCVSEPLCHIVSPYRPFHSALRFSTNARMPSVLSSVPNAR
jgi:hypothetical protein